MTGIACNRVVLSHHGLLRAYERMAGIDTPDLERTVVREVRAAVRDGRFGRRLPDEFLRPFGTPFPRSRGTRYAWTPVLDRAYVVVVEGDSHVVLTVLLKVDFFAPLAALVAVA